MESVIGRHVLGEDRLPGVSGSRNPVRQHQFPVRIDIIGPSQVSRDNICRAIDHLIPLHQNVDAFDVSLTQHTRIRVVLADLTKRGSPLFKMITELSSRSVSPINNHHADKVIAIRP